MVSQYIFHNNVSQCRASQ